ncbi:MAG: NAD(P)/FAD-dependent oxidoreductase [Hyphomonadaceae bacterium]|nr:NAD(P)/FAD-dependent oxidoreductase [Hyphomonadaceae bacterium]
MADGSNRVGEDSGAATNASALLERYRLEREKRLHSEGAAQFRAADGELAYILDDPHAPEPPSRAPVREACDVAIIGAGFGGLLAGARLRQAGVEKIRIIDRAAGFGGAWYWNRYPGASCDTEAYIYMPLLEETGYLPSMKYAPGPEIRAHAKRIAEVFDLERDALFQAGVERAEWVETTQRWHITTSHGDELMAQFLCVSTGPLTRPQLPGVSGLETFKGRVFHTSRWDYAYTGGDENGGQTGLAGKRVGIVGTGATAIQVVPSVADYAGDLFVFQRTPPSVGVRGNQSTDPDWAATLKPGWQQERMDNFNNIVCGAASRVELDLVNDGWTVLFADVGAELANMTDEEKRQRQLADLQKMEELRARIDATVKDPQTAGALKPYYNVWCKRPTFHDAYLDAYNRSNVHLVDTDGRGVAEFVEEGAIVGDTLYPLDCLILATGFEVRTSFEQRFGFSITGRSGETLSQKWQRERGVSTLHGLMSHDFPNLFLMGMPQAPNTPNFTHMSNEAAKHIAFLVSACRARGLGALEPSKDAEDAWVHHMLSFAGLKTKFDQECTPSYYNAEGQVDPSSVRNEYYPGRSADFIAMLHELQESGSLDGLILHAASVS